MNNVCLMGRLTADPQNMENKKVEIVKFTLAIDRAGKDAGADFIRIVCFGKTAEFAERYFTKGQRVSVTGHIQTGSYENKDGDTVYTTDIIADRLYFADSAKDDAGSSRNRKGGKR